MHRFRDSKEIFLVYLKMAGTERVAPIPLTAGEGQPVKQAFDSCFLAGNIFDIPPVRYERRGHRIFVHMVVQNPANGGECLQRQAFSYLCSRRIVHKPIPRLHSA